MLQIIKLAGAIIRRVLKISGESAVIVLIGRTFQSDMNLEKSFFDNRAIWCLV